MTVKNSLVMPSQDTSASNGYFQNVDIYDYDETVVAHPFMDQVKAAICDRLVRIQHSAGRDIRVLDAGTGSGQLARCILGLEGVSLSLADCDPVSRKYCADHPELGRLPFLAIDLTDLDESHLSGEPKYDVACALGVLHHVPPLHRGRFLRNLARLARTAIVADEGILEYSSEDERRRHAARWYDFVIAESKRRRLPKLAALEGQFKASDTAPLRGPNDDFKESPAVVTQCIATEGLIFHEARKIGDWVTNAGGMYLILFSDDR